MNIDLKKGLRPKADQDQCISNIFDAGLASVIIPTHNRASMIGRAIDSVLSQTYSNFELLIVSDCSTDNTEKIVKAYKDSRIQFLKHTESRGASAARNTGIRIAQGKYIAFLDDDDEWTPNKLELQLQVIASSPQEMGLVYTWMEYVRDGTVIQTHKPTVRGYVFNEMLSQQVIGACSTVVIKREVIDVVGYFDEMLPRFNDNDYLLRISKHYRVDFIPQVLTIMHVGHGDRITGQGKRSQENGLFALEKCLMDFREDFDKHLDAQAEHLCRIVHFCIMTDNYGKCLLYFRQMVHCKINPSKKMRLLVRVAKHVAGHMMRKIPFLHGFTFHRSRTQ